MALSQSAVSELLEAFRKSCQPDRVTAEPTLIGFLRPPFSVRCVGAGDRLVALG
jgi:hypothetical protein